MICIGFFYRIFIEFLGPDVEKRGKSSCFARMVADTAAAAASA